MMERHLTDGELRAALDGELEAGLLSHIQTCPTCQAHQQELQVKQFGAARHLAFLASQEQAGPSPRAAWIRFSQNNLQLKEISMIKRWFSHPLVRFGSIALILLALVLAFPSTRALAGEL